MVDRALWGRSLRSLPFYDGDVEAAGEPLPVHALRAAIAEVDAIVFLTPEYNDGTSAVLRNAIDWASRPPSRSVLVGTEVVSLLSMLAVHAREATEKIAA